MKRACLCLALVIAGCGTTPARVVAERPRPLPPVAVAGRAPGRVAITRIAHASVLIDFDGEIVLTDPWFTESSQYHHGEPLALAVQALPHLTAVVASHDHYDHFDLDAFAAYPDKDVPFFVAPGSAAAARRAGFRKVRALAPWQSARAGDVDITAAPAAHGTPEVTFVLQRGGATVFFGADTRRIAALDELPRRFPEIDVALLPINGLRAFGRQVVMTAEEAAELAATLHAAVAVPIHYTFRGGWFTDTFVLGYDGTPERFRTAVARAAPATQARVLAPGERLEVDVRAR